MGKNKLAKFEDLKTFSNVIQVPYNNLQDSEFSLKGNWSNKFFGNNNPLILELGCGKGEYVVSLAESNRDINYLGVDIKGARLWQGAKTGLTMNLNNVGFLRTNIEIIEKFFAPGEVNEIWLTFPDPQMKKTTKRLTSTFFLEKYRSVLKENAIIHLKTDSSFQYNYTRAVVETNQFEIIADTNDLYASVHPDDPLQIKTFYEKQWLARGIPIKYLAFKLHGGAFKEPEVVIRKDEYRSYGRSARNLLNSDRLTGT